VVETAGVVPSQELLRGLEVALVSCLTSLDLHETKLEVSLSAFLSRSLSFAPSISLSLFLSVCLSLSIHRYLCPMLAFAPSYRLLRVGSV